MRIRDVACLCNFAKLRHAYVVQLVQVCALVVRLAYAQGMFADCVVTTPLV